MIHVSNSKRKKKKNCSLALTKSGIIKMALIWEENSPIGLFKRFFHIAAYELVWLGGEAANCKVH